MGVASNSRIPFAILSFERPVNPHPLPLPPTPFVSEKPTQTKKTPNTQQHGDKKNTLCNVLTVVFIPFPNLPPPHAHIHTVGPFAVDGFVLRGGPAL